MKSLCPPKSDIKAFLEGRKTMFRMPIKGNYDQVWSKIKHPHNTEQFIGSIGDVTFRLKPPYLPGEVIYVKETWWWIPIPSEKNLIEGADTWPEIEYLERDNDDQYPEWGWKRRSPVTMSEEQSRIKLKILTVSAEQVQEITEEDAKKEGRKLMHYMNEPPYPLLKHKEMFLPYWNARFARKPEYQWNYNCWVWVFGCERVRYGT